MSKSTLQLRTRYERVIRNHAEYQLDIPQLDYKSFYIQTLKTCANNQANAQEVIKAYIIRWEAFYKEV